MELKNIIDSIVPADAKVAELAQRRLDSLTKPQGSLGKLEECARRYLAARGSLDAKIASPAILTFAGDHGIAEEGVSAFPQEVTPQMVANFARGGAAINVLARHAGADLKVIDIGVKGDCDFPGVIGRKIARGTANFAKGPAMTGEQCMKALLAGAEIAKAAVQEGSTLIGTGDMGIANTTPSAAIYSILLGLRAEDVVGRGTGIGDAALSKKTKVIDDAAARYRQEIDEPLKVLACVGGFEIAGICGTILQAASMKVPVVVDGFISGAAALVAIRLKKEVADYCFFSHLSAEAGHANALRAMGVRPLLDLDLRLGEGTGAAIAMTLISAGLKIMDEMATFGQAGVSEKSG